MARTFKQRKRKRLISNFIGISVLLILSYFAALSCKVDTKSFVEGIPRGIQFLGFMLPPDWSAFSDMLVPAFETVLLAFLATIFGGILSLFFGLAAAINIAPKWLRNTSRFLLTLERALPEIIIILLLIAALGLGAFPGVVALSIGCIGMLGKLFADAIEEINPKIIDSLASVGGNKLQIILFGVIPEVLPAIITNTIFRFEINIRLSVLIGAVGAGGIGYELFHAFNTLEYERATMAILITLALVFISERLSTFLRKKYTLEKKSA